MKRLLLIALLVGIVASGCDTLPTRSKDENAKLNASPDGAVYPQEVTPDNVREKFQALKMEIDRDMMQ